MCLVSYIPLKDGFVISSNRDEAPQRNATNIVSEDYKNQSITYPQDIKGGSWIYTSKHKIAVVLNGAFVKHKHQPPYKISRGLMLKSFFDYPSTSDFIGKYEFEGIEPFTALLYNKTKIVEFRWDGILKHIQILDPKQAHIFSSCTLYTDQQIESRKDIFTQMMEASQLSFERIKAIHRKGNLGDLGSNFIMNRENRVMTTSISHLININGNMRFEFESLISKTIQKRDLSN